jgi:hypothetical protein
MPENFLSLIFMNTYKIIHNNNRINPVLGEDNILSEDIH